MRIIDQNGCDYPYESIVISHGDGMIYARPVSNMEKQYFLARYSTEEKVEKAIQKLRECYIGGMWLMKNASMPKEDLEKIKNMKHGFIKIIDWEDNVRIEPTNMIFRFPTEEELE